MEAACAGPALPGARVAPGHGGVATQTIRDLTAGFFAFERAGPGKSGPLGHFPCLSRDRLWRLRPL